jgi:hypothetical protein
MNLQKCQRSSKHSLFFSGLLVGPACIGRPDIRTDAGVWRARFGHNSVDATRRIVAPASSALRPTPVNSNYGNTDLPVETDMFTTTTILGHYVMNYRDG